MDGRHDNDRPSLGKGFSVHSNAAMETTFSPHDVHGLTAFVDDVLPTLRNDADGLFCFDRTSESRVLRGKSVRYSMLVLLGLLKQSRHGYKPSVDVMALHRAIVLHIDTLGVGDLSLLLWAQVRLQSPRAEETLSRLRVRSQAGTLASLEGMEAAWFVIGTVEAFASGLQCRDLFDRAYAHLLTRKSETSPLFRHNGTSNWRSNLPNFATEIYTLLALAETARHGLAPNAVELARSLADTLIALRLPDAGWPWLFQADRAVVVEPYEVYSVHQDAMAPMALFALAEAVGDNAYARAAVEGFQWCFGANALNFVFYDAANKFAHRSIKRKGVAHSLSLWANTGLGGLLPLPLRASVGGLEINRTCRPYHLGWILEAWCGREHLHSLVGETR
jgi:hypothetical protein